MKIGLYLCTQFPPGADVAARLHDTIEQVRLARRLGWASLWAAHHYLTSPLQMIQPMPLLARLLPEAEGMTVGPNILVLPLLNPVHVAEEAATMDLLSGGRYVLGVGLGYRDEEFGALGVPKVERVGRLTEAVEVVRKLWSEDRVSHRGKHYTIEGLGLGLKPVQKPGPPIWVAASTEPAIRRAASIGDAWLITFYPSIQLLTAQMKLYRAGWTEAGKGPTGEMPILRECYVSLNHRTALEDCRGPLEYKYRAYASWGQDKFLPDDEKFDQPFEQFVKNRFIIGDAAFCREELQRYRETLGVDHFIMRVQWPGLEQAKVLRTIELLAEIAQG